MPSIDFIWPWIGVCEHPQATCLLACRPSTKKKRSSRSNPRGLVQSTLHDHERDKPTWRGRGGPPCIDTGSQRIITGTPCLLLWTPRADTEHGPALQASAMPPTRISALYMHNCYSSSTGQTDICWLSGLWEFAADSEVSGAAWYCNNLV